jgi:DNA-binding NarL/FixJ family response regulator
VGTDRSATPSESMTRIRASRIRSRSSAPVALAPGSIIKHERRVERIWLSPRHLAGHTLAPMQRDGAVDLISAGQTALEGARWEVAADLFRKLVALAPSPEAFDGLGRALWWLGEVEEALTAREQAYVGYKAEGEMDQAAKTALWLAEEYRSAMGRSSVAGGWLERAGSLVTGEPTATVQGWLALTRSRHSTDFSRMELLAIQALELGRKGADPDLEIRALSRLAVALVGAGRVEEGLARFDEAMVAATAESQATLETIGETYCDGFAMLELIGDSSRLEEWSAEMMRYMARHDYGPLVAFCGACCGELFAAAGDIEGAERELRRALDKLERTTGTARCVHPAASLAQLRLMQGRVEDAVRLIAGFEGRPEIARAEAAVALASGKTETAIAILERHLALIGNDGLASVPYLVALVDAYLVVDDGLAADEASDRLMSIAMRGDLPVTRAHALAAAGQTALARGDPKARSLLEEALGVFTKQRLPLDAATVRLLIARALSEEAPQMAIVEASNALAELERFGARHKADAAAALLRGLGVTGPPGPKHADVLSRREKEVLALLGDGLTNREIADRLYISSKTVDHHVSRVLTKLNLRNRSEAAAYSVRAAI